jgi:ubiquinone/menaquinone biosynthesis C-methylase UbiE
MIDLSARSYQKELLDDPAIPFGDIQQNMKELNLVNTYLGGHKISISGMKSILKKHPGKKSITLCEIGCGGGDNLKAIMKWCVKHEIDVKCIGIDINHACIEFAKKQCKALDATWIVSDYISVTFGAHKPDIILCSLFCHHFTDREIGQMLRWMKQNAAMGFIINDLHRHPLAYYAIKIITGIFSKSYLVKNDAPISVTRGFKKKEWQKLLAPAQLHEFSIQWKWAFRHLIISHHA